MDLAFWSCSLFIVSQVWFAVSILDTSGASAAAARLVGFIWAGLAIMFMLL